MQDIVNWLYDDANLGVANLFFVAAPVVGGFLLFIIRQFRKRPEAPAPPTTTQTATTRGTIQSNNEQAITAQDQAQVNVAETITQNIIPDPTKQFEAFTAQLNEQDAKTRADLERAHGAEKKLLEAQLVEITRQLGDTETAFQGSQKENKRLAVKLDSLDPAIVPAEEINKAKAALIDRDKTRADALFASIVDRAKAIKTNALEAAEQGAEAAYQRGLIAEADIRWADAAQHFAEAVELAANYDRLNKAGEFMWRAGDYAIASGYSKRLIETAKAEYGETSPKHATALNEQAIHLQYMGRYEEAEPLFRQAIETDEATIGREHPEYAKRLNNLANLLSDMGRYEEAEPLFRQAMEIDEATIGREHPDYAIDLNNLALLLHDMGRYEEAEPLFRQAMEIDEATIGREHPEYAKRLNNLANLLSDMGRYEEAEPLYRESIAIKRAALGDFHPSTKLGAENFLNLLRDQNGDPAEIAEMAALAAAE